MLGTIRHFLHPHRPAFDALPILAYANTRPVLWAQRSNVSDATKNFVYLTITAPDVPDADMKLDIQPTKLTFTGKSSTKPVTYHCELEFFAEIDPAESKTSHTGRDVEMVLRKKELKEEFWPRLLKEKGKVHFLRTDFDKVRLIHLYSMPSTN
jgi:hypothetical protein